MKPIYFPFTYLPKPAAEALAMFFRRIVVYQPSNLKIPEKMKNGAESGFLDIRIPVTGDETKLDAILKDYINWTNIHKGNNLSFFRPWIEKIPFWDGTSVSQIRAEIKNKQPMKPDPLFNARIFLHIAQEFDIQKMGISMGLQSVEMMQRDLLKKMKGEEEGSGEEKIGSGIPATFDFGSYMTAERFDAWARLFREDVESSGLFITTSPTAFEYLMEQAPESKMMLHLDSIPVKKNSTEKMECWKARLEQYLSMFEKDSWSGLTGDIIGPRADDPGDRTVSLTLYMVPETSPLDFFQRLIMRGLPPGGEKKTVKKFDHTMVGLVEG
jgi:hypothetical protein